VSGAERYIFHRVGTYQKEGGRGIHLALVGRGLRLHHVLRPVVYDQCAAVVEPDRREEVAWGDDKRRGLGEGKVGERERW